MINTILPTFYLAFLFLYCQIGFSQPKIINDNANILDKNEIELLRKIQRMSPDDQEKLLNSLKQSGVDPAWIICKIISGLPPDSKAYYGEYVNALMPNDSLKTTVLMPRNISDFGTVSEGEIIKDSFYLKNTGKSPYIIKNWAAGCSCTSILIPKKVLQPGETFIIPVEINTQKTLGDFDNGIILYDNSMPNQRNIFYVKGRVLPQIKQPTKKE